MNWETVLTYEKVLARDKKGNYLIGYLKLDIGFKARVICVCDKTNEAIDVDKFITLTKIK